MALETSFVPAHSDRLTVLQMNSDSSKLLTASIDHRVAVYDVDAFTAKRTQLDVFTAHDAEIRDAKWFHRSIGTLFVTLGNDLQMRVWAEDTYQAPMSGRRFKKIATLKNEHLVPFASVDVKSTGDDTYIAVIDRQGLLSIYEPTNPDQYHEWTLIDQLYVVSPIPGRGDHTSFRVQFDPNSFSLPYYASLSDDQTQVSIVVTAMNEVKVYRSTSDPDIIAAHLANLQSSSSIARGASHRLLLFQVLRIVPTFPHTSSGLLLRDVAFSPGNFRGTDIIALASINGTVAIYEVSITSTGLSEAQMSLAVATKQTDRPVLPPHQSNLTSALHSGHNSANDGQQAQTRVTSPFAYAHHARPLSVFQHAHIDAWSLRWDPSGQILLSSGSDGTVKIWRRMVDASGAGSFELFAEQAAEDDDEESEQDEIPQSEDI